MSKTYLFAGELSGDLLGAALMQNDPHRTYIGVGGPKMRASGLSGTIPTEAFLVMGFLSILRHLPRLLLLFYRVRREILRENPDRVILIDYAEFNLHLATSLRKKGFKGTLIQYVCPSVWAWRKGRIAKMEAVFDEVWTLFPFETECFTKLKATFVGHPLTRSIIERKEKKYLTLFPGSRTKEIKTNLPLQLKVAGRLSQHIAISVAHDRHRALIEKLAPGVMLFSGSDIIAETDHAIATSGTICLQLALSGIPTVVTYAIGKIDLFLAQKIFKIDLPHYCIVNILAKKTVFPELFGPHFTEDKLLKAASSLDDAFVEKECTSLRELLTLT